MAEAQDDRIPKFGPDGLKTISVDELDDFAIDRSHRLHWRGRQVIMQQKISLRPLELTLLGIGAAATAVQAIAAVFEAVRDCQP